MTQKNSRPKAKSLAILGTRGIPACYGGFETFAQELSVRLVAKGISVTVYCEAQPGEPQPASYQGVRLVYRAAPDLGPASTLYFDLSCLWHARKRHDVVYMLGYGAALFCFIPRLWGKEVWINMDGVEWARSKWSTPARLWLHGMERVAMWTPSRLIADAEGIKQHLEQRYRHMPPCTVIPYGAEVIDTAPDSTLLQEWNLASQGYCLIVCRLEPENHVLDMIQGYLLSSTKLPLVILGDIKRDTPYTVRLREYQHETKIRFLGTVYDQKKLQALRWHCACYFHGHSVGGTNPSLLEAMGCGNRIIAHDNVYNREVAGECAAYFSQADMIPGSLQSVLVDGDLDASVDAKKRVKEHYCWDDIAMRYISVL